MATVTYIREKTQNKTAIGRVMRYCSREDKTMYELNGRKFQLISGKDCCPETAYREFMATKQQYGKANGMFFYQYVQSFSPDEKITAQAAHEIGCKFAEYFKGYEVLIATHTDREHLHTHFIINSVSHENGKKLQMPRGSIYKLRQFSDEICKQYNLSIVQPKENKGGMKTREYRAAVKGESWKFRLMSVIDNAMEHSLNRAEFIKQMNQMGYQVKWQDNLKHITYTTPDGMKCRDNKLHENKYLKEEMEVYYGHGQAKGFEQAGESDRGLSNKATLVRDSGRNVDTATANTVSYRTGPSADTGKDRQAPDMGQYKGESESHLGESNQGTQSGSYRLQKGDQLGTEISDEETEFNGGGDDNGKDKGIGTDAQSERLNSCMGKSQASISGRDVTANVLGAALAIENLVSQPNEEQREQNKPVPKRQKKKKHKKKQLPAHDREWDMEM